MSQLSDPDYPRRLVEEGCDQVAQEYARLEGVEQWPRMRWLARLLEGLGVPMYFGSFDAETTKRMVQAAGFEIVETATETQRDSHYLKKPKCQNSTPR